MWTGTGHGFAAASVAVVASGCFYVPEINPVPEELDTPPFVLGFEPDVVVDLRVAEAVRFAADAVYDFNAFEEIDWRFTMFLSPDDAFPFVLDSGELRRRETQAFADVTEYTGPSISLPACQVFEPARGNGSLVALTLTLEDPLPASQRREGFERFEVSYTWRVRVIGECPQ